MRLRDILRSFSSVRLVSTTEGTLAFTESKSSIISVSKAIVKTLTVAEYVRPVRIGDGIPLRGQAEPERSLHPDASCSREEDGGDGLSLHRNERVVRG